MDRAEAALPNSPKGWMNLVLLMLFLIGVFIAVLGAVQHQNDEQFISNDELKNSVKQLESYSAEAGLLLQYTLRRSAPRPYTQTYGSSLTEATDSITQKLQEHPHADSIDRQVARTIDLSEQLSDQLNDLSIQPRDQLPQDQPFQTIGDKLQALEAML
jgi:hypothetical protein